MREVLRHCPNPEDAPAAAQRQESLLLRSVRAQLQLTELPEGAQTQPLGAETVQLRSVSENVLRTGQSKPTPAHSHWREAIHL